MKADLQGQAWAAVRKQLRRVSGKPFPEQLLRGMAAMVMGFSLAGFQVAQTVLPLPICLAAALGLSVPSFGAYLGGCLGYLVFSPLQALEPMAAGLLVQAALCIFGDQLPEHDRWFVVGCAMAFTALVGFLFLLEQRFAARMIWRYAMRVAVAGGGTMCFRVALLEKEQTCRGVLFACICAGACAVAPVGLPLGAVGACMLACAGTGTTQSLVMAALCGLAVDLGWMQQGAGAVFVLTALLSFCESRLLRTSIWLGGVLLGVLLLGADPKLLACAMLGAPLSLLLPTQRVFGGALPASVDCDTKLSAASALLRQLGKCLTPTRRDRPDPEMAAVFDQAAERVCRVCGGWDRCWNEYAGRTVEELESAAPAMMTRGRALRSDLPETFIERCCHVDGFLTAVNRELDDLSCRRQCRSRIRESRQILAYQYEVISAALQEKQPHWERTFRYRPEVGYRSEEAPQQQVSGDRGVTFRVGKFFYLILCDGMGTGAGADGEAGVAISVLRGLLQAEVPPMDAMRMLNGVYILRDDGGFATVDLVRADLTTGEVELLKWGSAPSYLKRKNALEKLGQATPPPGVGIGEEYQPEAMKLSLARGEMLVLLSDGAETPAAERFLRQYNGSSVKELAFGVISAQPKADDDRTAAVFTLRPRNAE